MKEQLDTLRKWLKQNNFRKEANIVRKLINKKSMLINGEPNDSGIIAYKENIWRLSEYEEIDENIRKEINEKLGTKEWLDFNDLREELDELERFDVLIGTLDDGDLYIYNTTLTMDPKSSVLVKKVTKELKLNNVYLYAEEIGDEERIPRYIMKGKTIDVAYHGTSTKYLQSILKFGIAPNKEKSNYKDIEHPDAIFFSSRFLEAKNHATHTATKNGGDPMILEFKIPNKNLLIPDYDVDIKSGESGIYDYIPSRVREDNASNSEMKGSSNSLSREFGIYGYKGRIPSSFIDFYYILMNSDENYEEDTSYKSKEHYTKATKEEAAVYARTKEEFGFGMIEYDEEDYEEEDDEEYEEYEEDNQLNS